MARKFKLVLLWAICILVIVVVWPFEGIGDDSVHTRRFCAYGHIYVEFEHRNRTWGTTFLNSQGRPLSCDEKDVQETVNLKGTI